MKVIKENGIVVAYRHWFKWHLTIRLLAEFANISRKKDNNA